MVITRYITLDVSRQGVQASIPITQHDAGTLRLLIQLRNGTTPIELNENMTAVLYIDTDVFDPVTIYTKDGAYPNYLEYNVSPMASKEQGEHKAVLQIFRNGQIYSAPEMILLVKEDYTNSSGVLSSAQYAAVVKAQEAAEAAAQTAKDAADTIKPVSVVQETGDSAEEVMSQKAVTDNLNFTTEEIKPTWYRRSFYFYENGNADDFSDSTTRLTNIESANKKENLDISGKTVRISVKEGYAYSCALYMDGGDYIKIPSVSEWQTYTEPTEWTANGDYKNLIIVLKRIDGGTILPSESENIKIGVVNDVDNEVKEKIALLEKTKPLKFIKAITVPRDDQYFTLNDERITNHLLMLVMKTGSNDKTCGVSFIYNMDSTKETENRSTRFSVRDNGIWVEDVYFSLNYGVCTLEGHTPTQKWRVYVYDTGISIPTDDVV